tara:strand:+ start:1299 stop:2786 length:1488 start_codon:yes stop_codon:yes gene_type:complete
MLLRAFIATKSANYAKQLGELLTADGLHVTTLGKKDNLWGAVRAGSLDLLVTDEELLEGGFAAGIAVVRALPEAPEVVVFTDNEDPAHRAELLAAGAFATLSSSVSKEETRLALQTLVKRRTEQAQQRLTVERADTNSRLGDFATASPTMREFLALVKRVANSDSTLLMQGETGVGKEYLSRAIHAESARSAFPFIAVNCSALSEALLESELFGHVEGAFTGAQRARRGYFELAHKGTLFIDEVGELSPKLQVKLLRVLQDRKIRPVGSEEEFDVDVRIITATNRDLSVEMAAKRFRADLFYRLSVVSLDVPPLRARHEDIAAMVVSHVEHFRVTMSRAANAVSDEAMERLVAYRWPGNVRELINVAERAVLLCETNIIETRDLPEEIRRMGDSIAPQEAPPANLTEAPESGEDDEDLLEKSYHEARREMLDAFEVCYIKAVLKCSHGRVQDAASIAGINPRSLYEMMKKHDVRKEFYKVDPPTPPLQERSGTRH